MQETINQLKEMRGLFLKPDAPSYWQAPDGNIVTRESLERVIRQYETKLASGDYTY
jgi:hypothetical protein